jgi:O-acetylserine/cysteine efflux transporter
MRPIDLLLALLVVVVWGLNFAVIKTGVAEVPPLLLGALRFLLAACPAVFPACDRRKCPGASTSRTG